MNLEIITLNEVRYLQNRNRYQHKKQTLQLPKQKVKGNKLGAWNYQIHTTIQKTENKDLLYSKENSIQYLVIIDNGKESEIYT